jgi:hypothetical protein
MDQTKLTHLSFIQNIISRLASNCFAVKGWSLLIITGSLALIELRETSSTASMFLFAIFLCWQLDSYFLNLEREYRNLYNQICKSATDEELKLGLPTKPSVKSHISASLSISVFPIYITETAFLIILNFYK